MDIKYIFIKTKRRQYCMNKFLIVGLGNIGAEYVNTRHNIDFKILDYFAKKNNFHFKPSNWVPLQNTNLKEEPFPLKPNTYMNLSGKAVQYWMDKEIFHLKTSLSLLI
jgi:PTH1 family peptidyl-tRNA hydrolase